MDVNWGAIAAVGEVVGAAGVVISLIYVSIQIRSNTRAMKATASFDATHSWATYNELALQNPALLDATRRAFDPGARLEDFDARERQIIGLAARALFQKLEGQYYLYKHGYMEPDLWIKRRNWSRGALDLPVLRAWWDAERAQAVFSDEFVEAIGAGAPIDVLMAGSSPPGREAISESQDRDLEGNGSEVP